MTRSITRTWVNGQTSIIKTKCLEVRLPDARTQSDRRRLSSVTLARSRVRVRAGYEFVSCRATEIKGLEVRTYSHVLIKITPLTILELSFEEKEDGPLTVAI